MRWEESGDGCEEEQGQIRDELEVPLNTEDKLRVRRPPLLEVEGSGCEELAGDDEGIEEGVEGLVVEVLRDDVCLGILEVKCMYKK